MGIEIPATIRGASPFSRSSIVDMAPWGMISEIMTDPAMPIKIKTMEGL